MARGHTRSRALAFAVAAVLGLTVLGCGDDDPETITTLSEASEGTGAAELEGFVVERDGVAKLCEALLESFPPQCGEPSVVIANVGELDAEFTTEQNVRWTDLPVSAVGTVEGGVLTLQGT